MRNLTLLTDFYELTMLQAYFYKKNKEHAVFDMFYRENPVGGAYSVVAGLEQVIEYIQQLDFDTNDINYLRKTGLFSSEFLEYLNNFTFTGDIYAVPEGTVVFPGELLVRVQAPIMEAQFIETALLNIINHQTLIATKASRVCFAADGDPVLEFGLRRAQGPDAGLYGARAAIIGGCIGTSNVLAGQLFDVPVYGTHAHSWVVSFESELEAFREYARLYPSACTLLVDTYDTLKSGVPNAITVFKEMEQKNNMAIRLDSGDLAYLSKQARLMLDREGLEHVTISASNDLDEYVIFDLKAQGAKIDTWGVGTNLITSREYPAFGGVYKLAAISNGNEWIPKIKLSEQHFKITNPGLKKVYRLYNKSTNKMKADLITLDHETIDIKKDLTIFDPIATWKQMTLKAGEYNVRELLEPIFIKGKCIYKSPKVTDIKEYAKKELDTIWEEHKRLVKPQIMPVDLSLDLYNLKQEMIANIRLKT